MKKILALVLCLILLCSTIIPVSAAGASATLSGVPSELKKDATATITVNVSGSPTLSSALVQVTLGDGLELVSGEWKKDGLMKDFTVANGYGVLALSSASTLNGTVFSFVVKGKTISATAQTVKVDFTFKNGSSEVGTASVSKTVKVACASHTYGSYSKKDNNNHVRTCTACGKQETKAHSWNSGTVTKTANCKEAGEKTFTCTICHATKTSSIAKTTNHKYGAYTSAGSTQHSRTCSVCQKVEKTNHSWDKGTVTKKATCKETGVKTFKCTKCDATKTETIAKTTSHKFGAWTQASAPECDKKGSEKRTCSVCSKTETRDVKALGHNFKNPEVTKEPTCTEAGVETGTCTRCGKESTNSIPATGHKVDSYSVTKEATCTEKGQETGKCTVCSADQTRDVEALGHKYGEVVVTKEATETETGIQTKTCETCGDVVEEEIPVKEKEETVAPGQNDDSSQNIDSDDNGKPADNTLLWILIAAGAVVVIGGGIAVEVVFKKKKANKAE